MVQLYIFKRVDRNSKPDTNSKEISIHLVVWVFEENVTGKQDYD